MFWIIFFLSAINPTYRSSFCTCEPLSIKENIQKSDIILSGRVTKIDTLKVVLESFIKAGLSKKDSGAYTKQYLVTLQLLKILKGRNQTKTVHVVTGTGDGDCGYYFHLNHSYLIYAAQEKYYIVDSVNSKNLKFKSHQADYYTTTVCDRTTESIVAEEKQLLRELKNR